MLITVVAIVMPVKNRLKCTIYRAKRLEQENVLVHLLNRGTKVVQ